MQPLIYKGLEISLLQNNEADILATAQCFVDGYYQAHPLFVALGINEEEFRQNITQGIREAVSQRPLQQIIAKDQKDLSKVVGVYLLNDMTFGMDEESQMNTQEPSEEIKFKLSLEDQLITQEIKQQFQDEIKKEGNRQIYQSCRMAILQEYQSTGLYSKFNQMGFFSAIEYKLCKGYINICYNKITLLQPIKHLDAQLIKQLNNIQDMEYKGKKLFQSFKNLVCALQFVPLTSQIAKSYHMSGKRELVDFYNQYITYFQGIPQNQTGVNNNNKIIKKNQQVLAPKL